MSFKKYASILLMLLDAFSVVSGVGCAYILRNKGLFLNTLDKTQPLNVYIYALPFAIVIYIFSHWSFGLYKESIRIRIFRESIYSIKSSGLWILLIMSGSYLYKYDYSRVIVVIAFILTTIINISIRIALNTIEKSFYQKGIGAISIAIIGTGKHAKDIKTRIELLKPLGYNVVGFINHSTQHTKNLTLLGNIKQLSTIIRKYRIQEVYIADQNISYDHALEIITLHKNTGVKFKIAINIFEKLIGNVEVARIESLPTLDMSRVSKSFWAHTPKRLLDLFVATFLYIITTPLWIIIGILIKFEDKKHILITQNRVGYKGKVFAMYKFRTMKSYVNRYENAPKNIHDNRITRVGKFLRSTSLDELPQLINVIKGDMSLVGPRPEMPQKAKSHTYWQTQRNSVKPGITGLWQVSGRKDLPLEDNLEFDFYYINNISFILDTLILLKTIPSVLLHKGAY